MAGIVGHAGLGPADRRALDFADAFEKELISQPERRALGATLDVGWRLLSRLPRSDLARLSDEVVARHLAPAEPTP